MLKVSATRMDMVGARVLVGLCLTWGSMQLAGSDWKSAGSGQDMAGPQSGGQSSLGGLACFGSMSSTRCLSCEAACC